MEYLSSSFLPTTTPAVHSLLLRGNKRILERESASVVCAYGNSFLTSPPSILYYRPRPRRRKYSAGEVRNQREKNINMERFTSLILRCEYIHKKPFRRWWWSPSHPFSFPKGFGLNWNWQGDCLSICTPSFLLHSLQFLFFFAPETLRPRYLGTENKRKEKWKNERKWPFPWVESKEGLDLVHMQGNQGILENRDGGFPRKLMSSFIPFVNYLNHGEQ